LTKFVFDANVIIGFYNIGHLKEILKKLEELDDRVYMEDKNYHEALIYHTAQKRDYWDDDAYLK
jgi:predicted nucleic acid-binding protein